MTAPCFAESTVPVISSLEDCNVTWETPSGDSFGSMPLGNGDVGLNLWVENNGDVVFYISKVEAFDSGHLLPKLGRVRVRFEPALDLKNFRQTLVLRDAAVTVRADDLDLRIWVDANHPVVRVEGRSGTPRKLLVSAESLRPWLNADQSLPEKGTAAVLFNDDKNRVAWCYRNQSSVWAGNFAAQNTPEMVATTKDPILGRTSGCVLSGKGLVRTSADSLSSPGQISEFDLSVQVHGSQPENIARWLEGAEKTSHSNWEAHLAHWRSFWDRSHIWVGSCGDETVNLDQCRFTQYAQGSKAYEGHKLVAPEVNAFQISQRYALERFCQAAASRGSVPPPYNGSIFTMDMPAGVLGFNATKPKPVSPDGRDWAILSFMWQNTRHPYWSMMGRGDYDTITPGMQFVRDGLEIARDRCRKQFGIEGAVIMEASWWHNVGVFNWAGMPAHLRYHQLATIEIPAMMLETYEHTEDRQWFEEVLLPCAEAGIEYYFNRFTERDAAGRMQMAGVGCAETYQGVTNPCTEIGCLKYLIGKLEALDPKEGRRAKWTALLAKLPEVPTRRILGMDLLAVGDVYDAGRAICESPELYSVYPFRQAWLGTPEWLRVARQSFHVRTLSLDGTVDDQAVETGGWQSAPVQAAYLGLAREAARLASINFNDRFIHWTDNVDETQPFPDRPRPRFPAFWECKMDGTPDNDHGANSVNTLQSMLLQSDGRKILLLPAWPEDWDVSFKLTAAFNTTVEGVYCDGVIQSLKVTPESRRADIVDLSTPARRIQTLVEVACTDRNWMFGLPPMLDGLPHPSPATREWLAKYGESVTGTRGAPWPGCTFRDNLLYVHGKAEVPALALQEIKRERLSDEILKIEYREPLEPVARATVSLGSLTAGRADTFVDLGSEKSFDRLEFTITNPNHRRGQAKPFRLETRASDGEWLPVHQGKLFGNTYAKAFPPVSAQHVRLVIEAPVTRMDLFERKPTAP